MDRRNTLINQFPMYAERMNAILDDKDLPQFRKILSTKLQGEMAQSKRRRIEKLVRKT